jgi:uncharacterized cupredoxin-like copper-binding protein
VVVARGEATARLTTRRRGLRAALALAALGLAVAPVAASSQGAVGTPARVRVVMTDYAFALSRKVVKPGTVVFSVVNKGEVVHDFRIAGKKTPVYDSGQSGTLRVVLKRPGRYPFICTVPGHALAGMKGVLRVVR